MKKFHATKLTAYSLFLCAAMLMASSCSDDDPEETTPQDPDTEQEDPEENPGTSDWTPSLPELSLSNQFFYDIIYEGDEVSSYESSIVDIKSVIYDYDNGTYAFYLSPTENLTTVAEMETAADYLLVQTEGTTGETYSISYKDIALASASLPGDIYASGLTLSLSESEETLSLDAKFLVNAATKSSEPNSAIALMVNYNGACSEAIFRPSLSDQIQEGKDVQTIGTVECLYNYSSETVCYNIYKEGSTTVALSISAPLSYDITDIDLSTDTNVKVSLAEETEVDNGTVTISFTKDKLGNVEAIQIVLEALNADEDDLRVNFNNSFSSDYVNDNGNFISTLIDGSTTEYPLSAVFEEVPDGTSSTSYRFVFGTNSSATTPEDLMADGHYAAEISISGVDFPEDNTVKTFNLSSSSCGFKVYDYSLYQTWNNANETATLGKDIPSGTLKIARVGGRLFFSLTASLAKVQSTSFAMTFSSDWVGTTTVTTIPNMNPSVSATNMFQILDTDGEIYSNYYREITSVEVAKVTEKISGTSYTFYYFFFVNSSTETNDGVDSSNGTPRLRVRSDYVNTDIDVATIASAGTYAVWHLRYSPFNASGLGCAVNSYDNSAQEGTLRVNFDETTKEMSIEMNVKDSYTGYSSSTTYGTGNYFNLSYSGTGVKYTGAGGSSGFYSYSSVDSMTWD